MSVLIDYTSGAFAATKAQSVGTVTGSDVDLSSGQYFEYTPAADTTFTFSNAPASGTAAGFALKVTGADVGASYDIANASYTTSSPSLQSVASSPRGLAFKADGTKMYVSSIDNFAVYQYSLSTAWDASTASYDSVSFSVSSETTLPVEIFFKPDGTEMYIASISPASVFQYTLSTAWDISSASFTGSFSVAVNMDAILKSDGTKMFTLSGTTITSHTLSTAWSVTSASSDGVTFSTSSQEGDPRALFVTPDGLKLFVVGSATDAVYRYSLPSSWSLSGASYDSVSFSVAAQDTLPFGLEFKTDGKIMYILGATGTVVDQYTSGSSSDATFTYPASVKFPNGTPPTAPAVGETDVLTFYTDDGGTTYSGFQAGDAMQ
jgi:sugar lactone lactonase YvrE